LKVLKGDAPYEVLDKVDVALTTRAYSAGQFAATNAIFRDSMENGGGQWSAGGNWTITAGRHQYMGISRAWKGNTAASLKLASPLDLSDITGNVVLKFQTAYKFGGGETGYLEISKDNNNWESAAVFSGEASWSDRVHIVDLSAYAGEPVVHIRFRLASAGGTSTDGWYIDNVVVAGQEGGALFLPIIFK